MSSVVLLKKSSVLPDESVNHGSLLTGFTRGRSTIDTILALRLLSEIHREFSRPLNVVYLDIKAAFDFVDRRALWKALHSRGIPDVLTDLRAALHENTGAAIRVGKNKSARLETTSGVREGCLHQHFSVLQWTGY